MERTSQVREGIPIERKSHQGGTWWEVGARKVVLQEEEQHVQTSCSFSNSFSSVLTVREPPYSVMFSFVVYHYWLLN